MCHSDLITDARAGSGSYVLSDVARALNCFVTLIAPLTWWYVLFFARALKNQTPASLPGFVVNRYCVMSSRSAADAAFFDTLAGGAGDRERG